MIRHYLGHVGGRTRLFLLQVAVLSARPKALTVCSRSEAESTRSESSEDLLVVWEWIILFNDESGSTTEVFLFCPIRKIDEENICAMMGHYLVNSGLDVESGTGTRLCTATMGLNVRMRVWIIDRRLHGG